MDTIIYLFSSLVRTIIGALMLAMLLRSLMSLLFVEEDNKFTNFIYFVTEPFITPVRAVLAKFNILQDTPIDFAFIITVFIISLVSLFI